MDNPVTHVPQSVEAEFHYITGEAKRLPARLEAKIPKMFGWQLTNKEYILWLDGNISLNNQDTLKFFTEQIQDCDIVCLRHHRRPNIRQEVRYLRKGLREQSIYLVSRYQNELWKELYEVIQADKEYVDDLLVIGGIFFYRNTPEVQKMMKEWWYYNSRYCIQDQLSFAYVLKKSGIRIKVLDIDYTKWEMIKQVQHIKRDV